MRNAPVERVLRRFQATCVVLKRYSKKLTREMRA